MAFGVSLCACAGNGAAPAIPAAPVPAAAIEEATRDALGTITPTVNVKASYNCVATVFGVRDSYLVFIMMSGLTPATVAPNAAVSMKLFQAVVTLPSQFVATLASNGVKSAAASATLIDMNASDTKSATIDAAATAIPASAVAIAANKTASFSFPAAGKTIGPWTASKAGTINFSPGTVDYTVTTSRGAFPFTCTPDPPITLTNTTVS